MEHDSKRCEMGRVGVMRRRDSAARRLRRQMGRDEGGGGSTWTGTTGGKVGQVELYGLQQEDQRMEERAKWGGGQEVGNHS